MSPIHALVLSALLLPTTSFQQEKLEGTWEAEFRAARVHLNLRMDRERGYSNYGRTFPASELSNLRRDGRNVSFELRRPAGTFRFEGNGNESRAAGSYAFTPDVAFRRALESAGLDDLTAFRMITLAINNVTLDDVRYMQRSVRGGFTTGELVRMLDHGAGPDFIREIHAAGFDGLSSQELTRTRDHGVDGEFIEGMRQHNVRLTLDEYIRARDHGVSPRYISELKQLGFNNNFEQLVRAKDHGVDADFVRELTAAGLEGLTLSHYIKLRDHGVDGDFAQGFRDLGYKSLSADQLIGLRNHGVSVGYARRHNREAGKLLAPEELIRRRSHGEH
jgi:hypothetical protein